MMTPVGNAGATEPALPAEEILSLVDSNGVAVFRGFALDPDGFSTIAECISPGARRGVGDQTMGLRLQAAGYYMPNRIDLLRFYCVKPSPIGGETTACDGIQVGEQICPAALDFFARNSLIYEIQFDRPFWRYMFGDATRVTRLLRRYFFNAGKTASALHSSLNRKVEDIAEDSSFNCEAVSADVVSGRFCRNAIISARCGGRKTFVNALLHALDPAASSLNQHYRLTTEIPPDIRTEVEQTTERFTEEIKWPAGDFAIVDNTRLMHGRRAYDIARDTRAINGVLQNC